MSALQLAGIHDLAERFDVFILDQFGVLHDGVAPYPGAVETLVRLQELGKRTLLLSNSGKRSAPNEARLARLGFVPGSWDHFLSSGEVAWQSLCKQLGSEAGLRCLLIARDGDRSAVENLPLTLVETGEEADIVLLSASEGDRFELDHYRRLLQPAAERGARCLCTNPDKIMLTSVGPRFGAGRIAELYAELGGAVTWIGKPFPEIYAAALDMLGNPDPVRVVCVGDSIEHDISGGQGAGLRTALVMTGVLETSSQTERERLFAEHAAIPDFLVRTFAW
ncbi:MULTISPECIES: TIGR01459 family HAD-type hydrolase [Aminobacter]|uniref:HAD superfamily hydrolase (TIGR01459 family) n=1 Tax=Aminobacter ciceronei TaxID=150723 RepID=A0ABR6C9A4_9HYPH|nr:MULTISPECIES: TIGR01459 family HAD-type hydrolase [Aminobacter]MBA8907674.1 HAD superfamily hydrolase (TIGR01459 family) [Aminobacter ciceronei]MBA9021476.1 HAD superfamily hydrolase (TIGR01459 family) [Aminobacter ciceronei]MRX32460.1 TIGR01459 family HAD-type hydrolase [Aminobacter sp. MDW-2]QNH37718.1 TIGR01459 family HAD-type hydrolase [Aminobacter sp. MDW-2]